MYTHVLPLQINMPSGAYVKVFVYSWGFNVYMYGLAEDRQRSSGLCGNFDDDVGNDLMLKDTTIISQQGSLPRDFSESYRLE